MTHFFFPESPPLVQYLVETPSPNMWLLLNHVSNFLQSLSCVVLIQTTAIYILPIL